MKSVVPPGANPTTSRPDRMDALRRGDASSTAQPGGNRKKANSRENDKRSSSALETANGGRRWF
jgi:hypothetical protein